jgi:hypothetical protein
MANVLQVCLLLGFLGRISAKIVRDGLWTGYDYERKEGWIKDSDQYKIENGIPTFTDAKRQREVKSAEMK